MGWIEILVTLVVFGLLFLWRRTRPNFKPIGFAVWAGIYLVLRGLVWYAGSGYHFKLHTYGVLIAAGFVVGIYLAVRQARTIAEALKRRRPGSLDLFEKNMHLLERDLLELDSRMMQIVARNPDQPLVASHPVYQYLARAYGLNIKSVSWEPGQYPEPEQRTRLERLLERHPAGWMIWEAKPYPGSVRRLHDLGISSLVFNPVPNRPDEGDFMEVMGRNLDYLEQAYKP
jgi:ABC-type Zn uptake system ZnuABC Zn-binding protein ZnuA